LRVEPPRAVHDRPRPAGGRAALGRRAGMGGGRGAARSRSRALVRARPHRAAHGGDRHGDRRRRGLPADRRPRAARPLVGPAVLGPAWGSPPTPTAPAPAPPARRSHGFLYDVDRYGDDRWVPIRAVELDSDYDEEWFPRTVHARLTTDDHVYEVRGDVWSTIP